MYDEILVPTDGSDSVEGALDHAIQLATAFDSSVHALYVADTNRDSVVVVGDEAVDALEEAGEEAIAAIEAAGSEHGVPVVGEVLQGDPVATIVDYAEARGIDLIVMSSRSRGGLSRYLLGSVTDGVTRGTDVPVLIVERDSSSDR